MSRRLLLIDYENVQNFDLTSLPPDVDVIVFIGVGQRVKPRLIAAAKQLSGRVAFVRIEGCGPNALDFHIACVLGRIMELKRDHECFILSKDTGFDPLLKYLARNSLKCSRICDLSVLTGIPTPGKVAAKRAAEPPRAAAPTTQQEANYKLVVDRLRKSPKASRPRRLKTLIHHVAAQFPKKLPPIEIETIITRLKAAKFLFERNGTISYG